MNSEVWFFCNLILACFYFEKIIAIAKRITAAGRGKSSWRIKILKRVTLMGLDLWNLTARWSAHPASYLPTLPFGCGLGSGGRWGREPACLPCTLGPGHRHLQPPGLLWGQGSKARLSHKELMKLFTSLPLLHLPRLPEQPLPSLDPFTSPALISLFLH